MALDGHDWADQSTDALKLSFVRRYITAINAIMGPDMSSAPGSASFGTMLELIKTMMGERDRLDRRVNGVGFTRGRAI